MRLFLKYDAVKTNHSQSRYDMVFLYLISFLTEEESQLPMVILHCVFFFLFGGRALCNLEVKNTLFCKNFCISLGIMSIGFFFPLIWEHFYGLARLDTE